jgi:hypothetical protein
VVPAANRYGGAKDTVAQAVNSIEASGGPEGFLARLAETSPYDSPTGAYRGRRARFRNVGSTGLFGMPTVQRLALEMTLHEEAERRALAGELAMLERAWREAEEIAAISDDMFVPNSVVRTIERLRGK